MLHFITYTPDLLYSILPYSAFLFVFYATILCSVFYSNRTLTVFALHYCMLCCAPLLYSFIVFDATSLFIISLYSMLLFFALSSQCVHILHYATILCFLLFCCVVCCYSFLVFFRLFRACRCRWCQVFFLNRVRHLFVILCEYMGDMVYCNGVVHSIQVFST